MVIFKVEHQIRVLFYPGDKVRLEEALAVYVRTTSPSLRTQAAQIQWKFEHPNNPFGDMFYVSLLEGRKVVGFAMFAYYPQRRLVVIDHIAIEPAHRNHGSFYVFASLLQAFIEERCSDYDFVAAEVGTDPEFSEDGTNGSLLIRLLRMIGFGRVHCLYDLPGLQATGYRKPLAGALMLRGAQKISEIRTEVLLGLHEAILFEHYLPWFKDFFGEDTSEYVAQLKRLAAALRGRLKNCDSLAVNGFDHDELASKPALPKTKLLGVEKGTVGHVTLFTLFLTIILLDFALLRPDNRTFTVTVLIAALVYCALAAQSSVTGLKVFEKFGGFVTKIIAGMSK